MKKTKTQLGNKKLSHELLTFPGYAGILLGWILATTIAVIKLLQLFDIIKAPASDTVSVSVESATTVATPEYMAWILAIIIILLMALALWVYVAKWTRQAVNQIGRLLKVPANRYWAYCTILLVLGWLIVVGLTFLATNDVYAYVSVAAFVAAGAITIGSAFFGLAALRKLPTDYRPAQKNKA